MARFHFELIANIRMIIFVNEDKEDLRLMLKFLCFDEIFQKKLLTPTSSLQLRIEHLKCETLGHCVSK